MNYNDRYDDDRLPLRRVWDRKHKMLGLTQKSAAARLGFNTPSTFAKYLTHQPLNKVSLAVEIARMLDTPVIEIIPNEVWEGVTPETIFAIAVTALSTGEMNELEQMICTHSSGADI